MKEEVWPVEVLRDVINYYEKISKPKSEYEEKEYQWAKDLLKELS